MTKDEAIKAIQKQIAALKARHARATTRKTKENINAKIRRRKAKIKAIEESSGVNFYAGQPAPVQSMIKKLLKDNPEGMTIKEIATALRLTEPNATNVLNDMNAGKGKSVYVIDYRKNEKGSRRAKVFALGRKKNVAPPTVTEAQRSAVMRNKLRPLINARRRARNAAKAGKTPDNNPLLIIVAHTRTRKEAA